MVVCLCDVAGVCGARCLPWLASEVPRPWPSVGLDGLGCLPCNPRCSSHSALFLNPTSGGPQSLEGLSAYGALGTPCFWTVEFGYSMLLADVRPLPPAPYFFNFSTSICFDFKLEFGGCPQFTLP